MDAFTNAFAIILAGGKSSRMGAPKFLLDFASAVDPEGLRFININAPQDYQTALRR
jgi:molybdopterin-guanine dinucleotide biosynthesis protein A